MSASILSELSRSHQVALTTLAATDREYCDRLQNSLVRGSHELLYWGVGPPLRRGDIVALYMPKTKFLPDSEHSRVRRLYFAAADSTPGSSWNQHVFLNRRVDLDPAITYQDLIETIGLSFRHVMAAGRMSAPLAESVSARLLSVASKRCAGGLAEFRLRAQQAKAIPKVCISYSGQDWTQAQRLKLWLDAAGLAPFFVSPAGGVLPVEEEPLRDLLISTFSSTSVVICLVPETLALSKWIQLEVSAALVHAKRLILVRTDEKRPWPIHSRRKNVYRYTLRPTREHDLVGKVKQELAALAVQQQRAADGAARRR